jgi:hypothetical protein
MGIVVCLGLASENRSLPPSHGWRYPTRAENDGQSGGTTRPFGAAGISALRAISRRKRPFRRVLAHVRLGLLEAVSKPRSHREPTSPLDEPQEQVRATDGRSHHFERGSCENKSSINSHGSSVRCGMGCMLDSEPLRPRQPGRRRVVRMPVSPFTCSNHANCLPLIQLEPGFATSSRERRPQQDF